MKTLRIVYALVALVCFAAFSPVAQAGPAPDPSQMSGIPRPDGNVAPGTITVRCLGKAGFAAPQVGLEVQLEVVAGDGAATQLTSVTQAQGRATFTGLDAGATATARANIGGAVVKSQPMRVLPSAGTAVLLVEGAASRPAGPAAAGHGSPGGPEIPAPGTAFALKGTPVGALTVGTFDLTVRKPLVAVEVTLTITAPDGELIVRKGTTDERGKFIFENLVPPAIPAGSKHVVRATLVADGPQRVSLPFEMGSEAGMALVLAEGAENFQPNAAADAAPQGLQARPAVPGPRVLRATPVGTVTVTTRDPQGAAIANQSVTVVRKTRTGAVSRYTATTDGNGQAVVSDIELDDDAFYIVETIYSEAPYQSPFFGLDDRGGVGVEMRLFETTTDRSAVRSVVQFDVIERENDLAQVIQLYEVMVQGELAFWDPELEIAMAATGKGFTVLRPAEAFLRHQEKAPSATLHGPLLPGERVNLSVAYLVEHDGDVELSWEPPFSLIQASAAVRDGLTLEATGAKLRPEEPTPAVSEAQLYDLRDLGVGEALELTVGGLRVRPRIYIELGVVGVGLLFAVTLLAFLLTPKVNTLLDLQGQRDRLMKQLTDKDAGPETTRRAAIVAALDRVYRRMDAVKRVGGKDSGDSKPTS